MKAIIIFISMLCVPILSFSQKNKFFLEFGGNYSKSFLIDSKTENSIKKETNILPAVGYSLTNRISLGLQYQYTNEKKDESGVQYDDSNNLSSIASTQSSTYEKTHYYGAIIRYNINNPLSKFKIFANLNPSITKSKSKLLKMSQSVYQASTTSWFSASERNHDISGYNIRLGLGFSYQLYKGLAVQYQLIKLASINSNKSPSLFTEEKTINTKLSFFNKPLENSFLSLKYTF